MDRARCAGLERGIYSLPNILLSHIWQPDPNNNIPCNKCPARITGTRYAVQHIDFFWRGRRCWPRCNSTNMYSTRFAWSFCYFFNERYFRDITSNRMHINCFSFERIPYSFRNSPQAKVFPGVSWERSGKGPGKKATNIKKEFSSHILARVKSLSVQKRSTIILVVGVRDTMRWDVFRMILVLLIKYLFLFLSSCRANQYNCACHLSVGIVGNLGASSSRANFLWSRSLLLSVTWTTQFWEDIKGKDGGSLALCSFVARQ